MLGQTIGYIDYAFGRNDNISIGIGYNQLYRLGTGQQSVISIMRLGETILSVSVSVISIRVGPTIGYIDYAWANNRYNRLGKKNRSLALVFSCMGFVIDLRGPGGNVGIVHFAYLRLCIRLPTNCGIGAVSCGARVPASGLGAATKTCSFLGAGLSPREVRTGYEGTQPENMFFGMREVVIGLVR